jgi:hypothetical protein
MSRWISRWNGPYYCPYLIGHFVVLASERPHGLVHGKTCNHLPTDDAMCSSSDNHPLSKMVSLRGRSLQGKYKRDWIKKKF